MVVEVKKAPAVSEGIRSEERAAWGIAGASLAGTIYAVLGFVAVYYFLPWLWTDYLGLTERLGLGDLMGQGLQMVVMAVAAVGLIWLWPRVSGPAQPGVRAGVFLGVLFVLAGLLVVWAAASLSEQLLGPVAIGITIGVAAAWLWFMWRTYQKETFHARLVVLEEQGWFTNKPYKRGQGLRSRRGTMLGIMVLIGAGLWVYTHGRHLLSEENWAPALPLGLGQRVILRSPTFVIAVAVAAFTMWFAYRLVNYPRFADFLIATEAEMNKVSWSTRRRLVQDTIVVLTTVVLMALFLLFVDVVWSFLLRDIFGVIQKN